MKQSTIFSVATVIFFILYNVARGQFHNHILNSANVTLQRSPPPRDNSFMPGMKQRPPGAGTRQIHLLTEPSAEVTTETYSGANCLTFRAFFRVEVLMPVVVALGVLRANHVM